MLIYMIWKLIPNTSEHIIYISVLLQILHVDIDIVPPLQDDSTLEVIDKYDELHSLPQQSGQPYDVTGSHDITGPATENLDVLQEQIFQQINRRRPTPGILSRIVIINDHQMWGTLNFQMNDISHVWVVYNPEEWKKAFSNPFRNVV